MAGLNNRPVSTSMLNNNENVPQGISSYETQYPNDSIDANCASHTRELMPSTQAEHSAFTIPTCFDPTTATNLTSSNVINYSRSPAMRTATPQQVYLNIPLREATPTLHGFLTSKDAQSSLPYHMEPKPAYFAPSSPPLSHLNYQEEPLQPSSTSPNNSPSNPNTVHPLPDRWQLAQHYRTRVHEPPQIDPSIDPTISLVTQNAEHWVYLLTSALTNVDSCKDTPTSHAYRLFHPSPPPAPLLEASARQIFTSLLDRCTHGFRGPASFNKALKPIAGLEADRFANCEERLRNVVDVLRGNKRVCKDVLYEDWKIRLLVNHPLAYDRDKDCQKGSNDQRRKRLLEERERLKGVEGELERLTGGGAKKRKVGDGGM
ncbi:unnamed protein product [Periconia digitata]|uniref:Uncharacterized protein n=1 Tax=Periconia digitata TaxID=1303443 RepID=A0A9W4UUF8_9PLEO|nr:unnamed protein product [Periconia digitata]